MTNRITNYISIFIIEMVSFVLISLFIYLSYLFYNPEVKLLGTYLDNPYYHIYSAYPLWIYLIICFTILSILLVSVFLIRSLYFSYQREKKATIIEKYTRIFTTLLSQWFLSDMYKTEKQKKRFIAEHKHNFKSRIQLIALTDTYLRMQETLAVNLSDDFKSLLSFYNIQDKIESFLYHANIDDRILAMKILSYLRITTHNEQIIKYADNKNIALRTEAYAALIRLMDKSEHLINFIGEKHSLSLLDFNIIVNAVLKNHKMGIDYRALLASQYTRKNMIGLILAKFKFRKNRKNLTLILNHLDSDDEYLVQLAWDALLVLIPENDAVDMIIDEFEKQNDNIKLTIVRNSKNIINDRFLDFLCSIIFEQQLLVKIEIIRVLFENDFERLTEFANSADHEIKVAYNEISNIYIT